jgi:ABC-type lipoprotein release transport system permease subunit
MAASFESKVDVETLLSDKAQLSTELEGLKRLFGLATSSVKMLEVKLKKATDDNSVLKEEKDLIANELEEEKRTSEFLRGQVIISFFSLHI